MIDLLLKFPALWALGGGVLGGFITLLVAWLIMRRYGPAEKAASDRLADLQKKQLETMEKTTEMQLSAHTAALEMQKTHYEGELNEIRKKAEADVTAAVARADAYEKHLHDKRNEWNAEKLQMTVEIEQLRARPDLGTLMDFEQKANERNERFFKEIGDAFKNQGDVMQKMATTLDTVATALTEHDNRMEEKSRALATSVVEGMHAVVTAIHEQGGLKKKKTRMKNKRSESKAET
jgi:hypothetical protein